MSAPLRTALLAALLCLAPRGVAQGGGPPRGERPRLVVMVAVDQLAPEQLERLAPLLTGGLGRFAREGLVFREALLRHGASETGPGHATYGTGCDPARHGIVANQWWDPAGETVYCVADPLVRPLTSRGVEEGEDYGLYRLSPRNLQVPGAADLLRAADPLSRSCSISSKDRAAIATAGERPDWALWWDRRRGGFSSSTWYGGDLPGWVDEWNASWIGRLRAQFGDGWRPLPEPDLAGTGTAADDRQGEAGAGGRRTFPYALPEAGEAPSSRELAQLAAFVYGSPAGDRFVVELAGAAVSALELGLDEHPDLLIVSLSSCDTVGHAFGPRSREVTDVLLRADRALGELFDLLDERVGRDRWIASLTSDHGVLELPEALAARGIGAVRVPAGRLSRSFDALREHLEESAVGAAVLAADSRGVLLARGRLAEAGLSLAELRREAAAALSAEADWLEAVFTWDELRAAARGETAASGLLLAEARSFDEERSPDLVLVPKPFHLAGMPAGTGHGSPYEYDRRVPLAFLGPGFPPGQSFEPASPADALPTLLDRLGLPPPEGIDGVVLSSP